MESKAKFAIVKINSLSYRITYHLRNAYPKNHVQLLMNSNLIYHVWYNMLIGVWYNK